MRYFPQLETGCLAQYPIVKRHKSRTIVNEAVDGSRLVFADDRAREIEWNLAYAGLSSAEVEEIKELFEASEGTLATFLFVDPAGNALRFSEDLSQPAWTLDAGLTVTSGLADPFGGLTASRVLNGSQERRTVRQIVFAPGRYQYCFSGYFRSSEQARISLGWSNGAESVREERQADTVWRRFFCTGSLSGGPSPLVFEIELPEGRAIEIFGLQVEAQREPSGYQRTTNTGGVYEGARFLDDTLRVTCEGVDDYSVQMRIGALIGLEA